MTVYSYGKFSPDHLEKIKEGVELFNQQLYWECHESLEHVWLEDRQDLARNVYWAVIQVAAACIHFRDKNLIGAQGMINKAKEKFRRIREHQILDQDMERILDWKELEALTFAIPDLASRLEDYAQLFEFRFKNFKLTSS